MSHLKKKGEENGEEEDYSFNHDGDNDDRGSDDPTMRQREEDKEEENGKVNDFNDNSDNDDDYDDYDNEDNNIDFEGVMTLLKSERVSAWEKRCWYAD